MSCFVFELKAFGRKEGRKKGRKEGKVSETPNCKGMSIVLRSLTQETLSKGMSSPQTQGIRGLFQGQDRKAVCHTLAAHWLGFGETGASHAQKGEDFCSLVCISPLHPVLAEVDLKDFRKRQFVYGHKIVVVELIFFQYVHFCLRFFRRLTKGPTSYFLNVSLNITGVVTRLPIKLF